MTRVLFRIAFAISYLAVVGHASAGGLDDLRIQVEHLADTPGMSYVGEPVDLMVTTTNQGSDTLKGELKAFPSSSFAHYYAQAKGHSPFRIDEPFERVHPTGLRVIPLVVRQLTVLRPEESTKVEARFLLNPRTTKLWLPSAGEYDLWVVLRPFEMHPELEVRSEPIKVVVNDPLQHMQQAFDEYVSQGLLDLLSDPQEWLRQRPRRALVAEGFVVAFGETPYGRHVRKALGVGLRDRSHYGKASPLEKEVYRRLIESERTDSVTIPAVRE